MTTRLRFLHVCERSFADLGGDDPQRRRCETCSTVVHNLDAMDPAQQAGVLSRAERTATTVCVSLSVPQGAAQACRAGQPIAPTPVALDLSAVPLAGVVAVEPPPWSWEISLPARGDGITEWRTLAADVPAVTAAIGSLGPEFGLQDRSSGGKAHWAFSSAEPAITGDVVVITEGKETAVGVRIVPDGPLLPPAPVLPGTIALSFLALVGPPWLVVVLVLWLAGLAAPWDAILWPTLAVVALVGVLLVRWMVGRVREASRLRAVERWSRAWRRRLWPALAARLGSTQPYR